MCRKLLVGRGLIITLSFLISKSDVFRDGREPALLDRLLGHCADLGEGNSQRLLHLERLWDWGGLGLREDDLLGLGELSELLRLRLLLEKRLLGLGKHLRGLLRQHLALRQLLRQIIHQLALGIDSLRKHILRYRLGELHRGLSELRLLLTLRLGHGHVLWLTIGDSLYK